MIVFHRPLVLAGLFLVLAAAVLSCRRGADNGGNGVEALTSYCVRQCVVETADAEICDTECRCAAQKLSNDMTESEFKSIVQAVSKHGSPDESGVAGLREALGSCKQ